MMEMHDTDRKCSCLPGSSVVSTWRHCGGRKGEGLSEKVTFELGLGSCVQLVQGRQSVRQVVGTDYAKCRGVTGYEGGDKVTCSLAMSFWPMWVHQLLHFFQQEEEEERASMVPRSFWEHLPLA